MASHQFKCGEKVFLTRQLFLRNQADTIYEVMAWLSSEGAVPSYRVKAAHEAFSRVAAESTMVTVRGATPTGTALDFSAEIAAFSGAKPIRPNGSTE